MKYLANCISLSRPLLALSLFWFINNKKMFIVVYALCWLTDAIDGPIARATKSQSEFGSKLDDLGDTSLIVIMGIIMIIWLKWQMLSLIPLILCLIAVRICNLFITKNKFGRVYITHTYMAKGLGFLVMLMPVIYLLTGKIWFVYLVLAISIITSLEETLIHITSDKYNQREKAYSRKCK